MEKVIKPKLSRSMIPGFLFSTIFFSILLVLINLNSERFGNYTTLIYIAYFSLIVLYLVHLILRFKNIKNTQFSINKKSVSYKQTFLSEEYVDIPVSQITNITYSIGFFWDKIFGTGKINFFTSGSSFRDLSFYNMVGVENLYDEIGSILKLSKSKKISKEGEFSKTEIEDEGIFLRRIKPDAKLALIFNIVSSLIALPFVLFGLGGGILGMLSGTDLVDNIVFLIIGIIVISVLLFLLLNIIFTYKRYKRIYYDFYTDKLEYYDGFLTLNKITIPLERITNVDSSQSLIEMLFGIYTIKIETAGSSGSEININYIRDGPGVVNYLKEVLHKHGRN